MQARFAADRETILKQAGIFSPPGSPFLELLEKRLTTREATGTFAISNSLAAALAPWLIVGIGIAAAAWRDKRVFIAWLVCLAPIVAALVLTKSRSGFVAVAVGILWLATVRLRFRPRHVAAGAIAACLLIAVVLFAVHSQPWFTRAANSFGFRLQYWQATLAMIGHHPLGCGPGNFQDVDTQFKLPEASETIADPHNFLSEVWATAGTPAMLALVAILAMFFAGRTFESVQFDAGRTWRSVPQADPFRFPGRFPSGRADGPNLLGHAEHGGHVDRPARGGVLFVGVNALGSRGPHLRGLLTIGVAVLLICLLTTGGIGIPGISQTLWLLLALGQLWSAAIHRRFPAALRPLESGQRPKAAINRRTPNWQLHSCCSYSPSLPPVTTPPTPPSCLAEVTSGRHGRKTSCPRRGRCWNGPCGPIPMLARRTRNLPKSTWKSGARPSIRPITQRSMQRRHGPQPGAAVGRRLANVRRALPTGVCSNRRPRSPRKPQAIEQAAVSACRAVELYPTSSADHAALAIISHLAGDEAAYRREALAAIELDDRMPHADKKLPPALRRQLESAAKER